MGLLAAAKKRYRNYSLGMKQRLAIAAGLLQPRELIILDEPTNGLDPQGTREVRALIRQIAADGTTVFVSSHLLAEVEQICTHVGVMRTGRLVFQGSLPELRRTGAARVTVQTADPEAAAKVLAGLGLADAQATAAEVGDVRPEASPGATPRALARRRVAGAGLRRARPRRDRRPRLRGHLAQPGRPVRRAHRGGLRCRRLRFTRSGCAWPVAGTHHGPFGPIYGFCRPSSGWSSCAGGTCCCSP